MNDLLSGGPFTAFDLIVFALVLVSALMAFARGFIRELASVIAFLAAIAVAFFAQQFATPYIQKNIPEGWSIWIANGIVLAVSFFVVYVVAAWFGQKFTKLIHTAADISFIDRLFGFAFGALRGTAVIFLVLLASRPIIEEAQITWITNGFTYPYFVDAVIWVQNNFMGLTENVRAVIVEPTPTAGTDTP